MVQLEWVDMSDPKIRVSTREVRTAPVAPNPSVLFWYCQSCAIDLGACVLVAPSAGNTAGCSSPGGGAGAIGEVAGADAGN
mmetsp:Transcript_112057/g.322074  ORF Transcript_112057/g.322074 Transcript_112057/m.322074 type:complete len:81 (+) Transcript_112057:283-525(+)